MTDVLLAAYLEDLVESCIVVDECLGHTWRADIFKAFFVENDSHLQLKE